MFIAIPIFGQVGGAIVNPGPGSSVSGTTNNVAKFTSSTAVGNSSLFDDGTNATQMPNGWTLQTAGSGAIQFANDTVTGTTLNKMACANGSGKAIVCPTSNPGAVIGVCIQNCTTSGNATLCVGGRCLTVFDNQNVVNNWAVLSTTTAGDLHDTGSTTETASQQNVISDSLNAGAGTTANIRLYGLDAFSVANKTSKSCTSCVLTNSANSGTSAFTLDASASTAANSFKIPAQAGLTSGADGSIAYDTTAKLTHVRTNAADSTVVAATGTTTTANKLAVSTAVAGIYTQIDYPDVKIIPAANCVAGAAGGGWNYPTSTFTATCRAGTNNLGGSLQAIPSTGANAQFMFELPKDWDTTSQPFISIFYASGANTSGTVIWTVSSACSKEDGSVTDDPAFNAESAFVTQTMAVANRAWAQNGQFTAITSGNNCIAGSSVIVKMALSGTAASNINVYQAVMTVPRLITMQAN